MSKNDLTIGIVGLGTINQEVVNQAHASGRVKICWIIDRSFRNPNVDRTSSAARKREAAKEKCFKQLSDDTKILNHWDLLRDEDKVDVVVEATGTDVIDFLRFKRKMWGDDVLYVTANKAMVAKHLHEFFGENCTDIRIEASVAAGLPLIRSLSEHIAADNVEGLVAILNGTTNYMLDEVALRGASYDQALSKAIDLGYAEPGGQGDVDGVDAGFKLRILSRIAFQVDDHDGALLQPGLVRGIDADPNNERFDQVRGIDFTYAQKLGTTIKLVGIAETSKDGKAVSCMVHPALIPLGSNMARVDGPDNYVEIYSTFLGYTDMQGQGAGPQPTACSLLADAYSRHASPSACTPLRADRRIKDADEVIFDRWMVRAYCYDFAGVLAHIFNYFEQHGIGIDEVFQLQTGDVDREAWSLEVGREDITPFAFTTTQASLGTLRKVLAEIPLLVENHQGQRLFPEEKGIFAFFPLIEVAANENGSTRLSSHKLPSVKAPSTQSLVH